MHDITINHFADDTCIIFASKKMKTMETLINHEVKLCTEWLKTNRLSLNVDKSKLIIFQSKQRPYDYSNFSIKLNGLKINHSDYVKYLGVYIHKNLSWGYQINQVNKKHSCANGVISKLRHLCPRDILINVYYSIFYSHLMYSVNLKKFVALCLFVVVSSEKI